jgi:hypothetical protein
MLVPGNGNRFGFSLLKPAEIALSACTFAANLGFTWAKEIVVRWKTSCVSKICRRPIGRAND